MPGELDQDLGFYPSSVGPAKSGWSPSGARWWILLCLLPFTALTYLAIRSGSPGDARDRPVELTTLATITGPFVGAIARNGQGCCLGFFAVLEAICGPVLAVVLLAQVVPLPFWRGRQAVRLVLWALGWLPWLSGGLVSFGHALS